MSAYVLLDTRVSNPEAYEGYKALADRYKVADIEAAADAIVWACDEAPGFTPGRPRDLSFTGTIDEAMLP